MRRGFRRAYWVDRCVRIGSIQRRQVGNGIVEGPAGVLGVVEHVGHAGRSTAAPKGDARARAAGRARGLTRNDIT